MWMFKPIKTIGNANTALQQCLASAERIFYLLDIRAETGMENDTSERDLPTQNRQMVLNCRTSTELSPSETSLSLIRKTQKTGRDLPTCY